MPKSNRLTFVIITIIFSLLNVLIILHKRDSAGAKAQVACRNPPPIGHRHTRFLAERLDGERQYRHILE